MTLRSYLIAIPIVVVLSVGGFIGGVWFVGGNAEHFFGQDGEE